MNQVWLISAFCSPSPRSQTLTDLSEPSCLEIITGKWKRNYFFSRALWLDVSDEMERMNRGFENHLSSFNINDIKAKLYSIIYFYIFMPPVVGDGDLLQVTNSHEQAGLITKKIILMYWLGFQSILFVYLSTNCHTNVSLKRRITEWQILVAYREQRKLC